MNKLLITTVLSISITSAFSTASAKKFSDSFNNYTINHLIAEGGKGGKG